ncbi:MAG: DUF6460 domain-containing protein [Caulobacterales bacterium]|uniref:DUF6460 domain-containing protein n=1 Tax=Glycocaulis sp. TaxID=1969725 RepID=UPI003F9F3965
MSDTHEPQKTFLQRLVSVRLRDILVLFLLCVLAGLVLALFNIDPAELWVDFFGTIARAWDRFFVIVTESLGWSVRYFLLGAVLVVPLWILWRVFAAMGRRS